MVVAILMKVTATVAAAASVMEVAVVLRLRGGSLRVNLCL